MTTLNSNNATNLIAVNALLYWAEKPKSNGNLVAPRAPRRAAQAHIAVNAWNRESSVNCFSSGEQRIRRNCAGRIELALREKKTNARSIP